MPRASSRHAPPPHAAADPLARPEASRTQLPSASYAGLAGLARSPAARSLGARPAPVSCAHHMSDGASKTAIHPNPPQGSGNPNCAIAWRAAVRVTAPCYTRTSIKNHDLKSQEPSRNLRRKNHNGVLHRWPRCVSFHQDALTKGAFEPTTPQEGPTTQECCRNPSRKRRKKHNGTIEQESRIPSPESRTPKLD